MGIQAVQLAMNSVGPLADLLVVDEYEAERLWHIGVDENTELFAELAEERDTLVLSIELGEPTEPAALYELGFRYAHVFENNDGARLTLDDQEGSMWIVSEIGATSLTPEKLAAAIRAAAVRAAAWREIVKGARAADGDTLTVLSGQEVIQA